MAPSGLLRISTMARAARKSPMQRRWGLFTLSMVIIAVVSGRGLLHLFTSQLNVSVFVWDRGFA
jgi:succinate-acetate transporter protein